MKTTINTEYPTSALDKGKIGDKQTRLDKRNKSRLKEKKGGEVNFVYNTGKTAGKWQKCNLVSGMASVASNMGWL